MKYLIYCITFILITLDLPAQETLPEQTKNSLRSKIIEALITQQESQPITFGFRMVTSDVSIDKQNVIKLNPTNWRWGKMTYSFRLDAPIKVDYENDVSIWENGKTQYVNKINTIAYNGEYWISFVTGQGPLGLEVHSPQAVITADCPKNFHAPRWGTPELFFPTTALLWKEDMTLIKWLKERSDWDVSLLKSGILEITITDSKISPCTSVIVDIDPAHAFRLVKIQRNFNLSKPGDERFSINDEVLSYIDISSLSIPAKCKRSLIQAGNTTRIVDCELYDPKLHIDGEKGIFDLALKPGTIVTDKRFNTTFTVGRSADSIINDIKNKINN